MQQMPFVDDIQLERERAHLVHVLRHLAEHLDRSNTPTYTFCRASSRMRDALVCEMIDVKRAIAALPQGLRRVVTLLGMQGLDEFEASRLLGVSRKTVNRRIWNAATHVQESLRKNGGRWSS